MRIGVLADIHANFIALNSVLQDCHHKKVAHLLVLGDMIGYYYWPDKVLEALQNFPSTTMIQGNHERMLHDVVKDRISLTKINKQYAKGIEAGLKLDKKKQEMLFELSETKEITMKGYTLFLCHGSPFNRDQYIYPDAERSILEQCMLPDCDFIFMGHTHFPFCFIHNDKILANPGSVGQPRDIGNLASYIIIDLANKTLVFRRIPFDSSSVMEKVIEQDPYNDYLKKVLLRKGKT